MAKRGAHGFDMEVGYCSRTRREDVDYRYFDRLEGLATWCDVLMIAAPGGPETHHAVNRDILRALGPDGYLINVARGSLVDSNALIDALREERIAGAASTSSKANRSSSAGIRDLHRLVCRRISARTPPRPFDR
jgi:lactate dehydrogenase-like 2-hydroxyacid dehydrogenase